jgi:Gram-negative bacterial TonB protein C-terminal
MESPSLRILPKTNGMKRIVFLRGLLFASFLILSQQTDAATPTLHSHMKVDVLGANIGPEDPIAWKNHLVKAVNLPASVVKNMPKGQYKVEVLFMVNANGKISEVTAENDPGYGLAEKATTAVKNFRGKWIPAVQGGRKVKAYHRQPVTFVVE